jgi:DNA-directed RNA polymerase specialized sigma24 family protein
VTELVVADIPRAHVGPSARAAQARLADVTELELARRVACGDMSALEEVYSRYHTIVYTLCLRMTRNVAEAEDLSQEVFINLQRNVGSYRGEAAFSTWIHRVMVNRVLNAE